MELHMPSYYPRFHCLAGSCPHTCCGWWEVPVDRASAARYGTAPGPLGERVRALLTVDGAGEDCFCLSGGTCPLLNEEGLCTLQLTWGEESLPLLCREHPRFSYDYGPVRELGLCASCPEAARLVLEEDFSLRTEQCPGAGEEDPLLFPLLTARAAALDLLAAPEPLGERLRAVLLLGNDVQTALDADRPEAVAEICQLYREAFPHLEGAALPSRGESLRLSLECLLGLEHLMEDWGGLLEQALAAGETLPPAPEVEGGRTAAYFLYRHWLRALNDGDLLSWCQLAVLGTQAAGALAPLVEGGFAQAFRRLCLEVEHAQENLDALQDALWHRLTLAHLLSLAGE